MKTPDLTLAQLITYVGTLATAAIVLFKLDLTDAQQAALISGLAAVSTIAWKLADAIIRHGRATAAAAQHNLAAAQIQNMPVEGDDSLVQGSGPGPLVAQRPTPPAPAPTA